MHNLLPYYEPSLAEESRPPTMSHRAMYLMSQGRPLFTWLHQRAHSEHGILICAPAGYEQVHSHRALRHLADRLAEAGFAAVRFDYHDTGDSADLEPGDNTYTAWLTNLRDVLAWMRGELGFSEISVMGLRLGATLATQIAAELPVHSLILWEPIVRGRGYVRELKMLGMQTGQPPIANEEIEAAGFVFGKSFCDEISRVDLLKLKPQCERVLLLSRDDIPADGKLLQHWQSLGIKSEHAALPGYADMLAEPHFTKVPEQAIAATMNWLLAEPKPMREGTNGKSGDAKTSVALPSLHWSPSDPCLSWRERIVQIRSTPGLFGILTEPLECNDLPLIVLLNAGSVYRVGPGRLHVQLARQLAGCGFRCLRMDLGGLGDSPASEPQRENDPYAETAFRDIDWTLRFVQTELAAHRVILMGLCSGAYFAFQAVAQIANPILVESVLINPLTFFWKDGMSISDSPASPDSALQYYLSSARSFRKWLKLCRGGTRIGIFGAFKLLMSWCSHSWQSFRGQPSTPGGADERSRSEPGHPAADDLNGDLERVRAHGRPLAFFFAQSDPGYRLLKSRANRKAKQLCQQGKMSLHFVENADHTFSRRAPRQALLDAIAAHLCQRYHRV